MYRMKYILPINVMVDILLLSTSAKTLVRAELVQGVALGEKFIVGYSDARSDCRNKRWM